MESTTFIQVQCFASKNETNHYATLSLDGYKGYNWREPKYGIEEAREHIKQAIASETEYLKNNRTHPEKPKTVYKIVRVTRTEEIIETV